MTDASPTMTERADVFQVLVALCKNDFCIADRYAGATIDSLEGCGTPVIQLLICLSAAIRNPNGEDDLVIKRCDDLIALANEKFYAFPFKDVPPCWRELYREASLLKFSALVLLKPWEYSSAAAGIVSSCLESDGMDAMVSTLDMALIMAGPPLDTITMNGIESAFKALEQLHVQLVQNEYHSPPAKKRKLLSTDNTQHRFPISSEPVPPITNPVPQMKNPGFEKLEAHMLQKEDSDIGPEPIILTGTLEIWPAIKDGLWSDPSYLLSKTIGGRRLVPIETGRSYVDESFGQKIISFKQFMNEYILPRTQHSESATGYLAQYDLFAQVPSLRLDVAVPDYCYTRPPPPHYSSPLASKHLSTPQLDEPLLNAWFGPSGTISPLHTDPYHNILAQVVGKKYVRLYAPRESEKLYARGFEDGGIDMRNTSASDVGILAGFDGTKEQQQAAHEMFPMFKDAVFVDCLLEEGDCLYIPIGWWHYVRSLSVSFSVSFWFN